MSFNGLNSVSQSHNVTKVTKNVIEFDINVHKSARIKRILESSITTKNHGIITYSNFEAKQ